MRMLSTDVGTTTVAQKYWANWGSPDGDPAGGDDQTWGAW